MRIRERVDSRVLLTLILDYVNPQIPRGEPAAICFKAGLAYIEQNQLKEAILCLDESFLGLAKERSLGTDIKPQARIIAQYKVAVQLLQVTNLLPFDAHNFFPSQQLHALSFCPALIYRFISSLVPAYLIMS